ncbi:Beta-barrel assembly machine subunit BamA [Limimaricola soesokkakensis]|uniref:Outer membrane protein assembly factor BamA n=2 Tax=Limimaricola TaxID=2211638 RepID=A0A1X6ZHD6_9RHOB|nr:MULTISPECIES: outer membrane protein assembly factor BamA [Limimaricola]MCZ4260193.1 outer membrane protein assembly factor BamA [Limimaricola sp. G21655-S1]PSK86055.1 Beta-barrel assembly machine subunit BamA [Limimaricola soesokkakensis]SLN50940.1 Outer membrane protein assembly factor BamA precursor [Limimaricola soesokkakensis]
MTARSRGALARRLTGAASAAALIAAISAVAPALAQDFRFEEVSVEGNRRIETGTILTYAGISRGETVSAAALNDAGQRIRETGLFRSVEIRPEGGRLVIEVTEFPTINRIGFEGNAKIDDAELAQLVTATERRVYNPAQAQTDADAIAAAYAERGRINAVVRPALIERSDNRVDLVYQITEGGVTEIERISFTGNRAFSDRRLRGVLATSQAGPLRQLIKSDTFVADRIAFDRQMLTDFYRSRGYVDFEILDVDAELTRARDAYLLTFNVREGQRYQVNNVNIASEIPGLSTTRFDEAIRLDRGDYYSPTAVEDDIARMERIAIRDGIDFLRIEPRITRNPRDLSLEVTYVLSRGERIFVERIDIEGNSTTLDRVVRQQFRTVEGDPFNPRAVRESAERIRALGYFADAQVNARPGTEPGSVVIDVDVEEQPTGSLSFGANYSTDDGFGLVAGFAERNFLGRGQLFSLDLSTSENNRVISFDFAEPAFLGRDLRFGFGVDYRSTDNDSALYDTDTFRISPSFTFPVSENGRLQTYYAAEYNDITDVDPDASDIIIAEQAEDGVWTNSLGYSYSYDTRRSGLDPDTGILLRFGQEFGVGDESFVKTTALASAETLVLGEDVLLRATVEGGIINHSDGTTRVTDRFFMGSRIMRGFEAGGIGPRDADTDDALGGNKYAVTRLEAEFPLGLPEDYGISGGAFVDYGSVWDVGSTRGTGATVLYDEFTPRAVVGASVFWDTPLGPLRFNFTEALEAEEFDETRGFDLTISSRF